VGSILVNGEIGIHEKHNHTCLYRMQAEKLHDDQE